MKRFLLFFAALCSAVFVWADAPKMADGATVQIGESYMEENILLAGGVPELLQGTITYDPENHVLTLTDVLIETATTATVGMGLGCVDMPDVKQMEIRIIGTNIIRSSQSDPISSGLFLGDGNFTITGSNGTLKIMTNSSTALWLGCDELIIKDGVYVYAGYSETGFQTKTGTAPALWSTPVVNIDCATLVSYGTECSMSSINPGLTDAAEQDGYQYNNSTNYWTEDGTTVLKGKALTFAPTKHIFWCLNAVPEGGTITATKNGNPITDSYRYEDSEGESKIEVVAEPNEGWEFVKWVTWWGYVDDNVASTQYTLPTAAVKVCMLTGYFRKTDVDAPSNPWYMLSNSANSDQGGVDEYTDLTKASQTVATSIPNKTKVTQATFAEGKLYYLDQQTSTEVAFFSTTFDPSSGISSSRDYVFTSQTTYQQFYALTYSIKDGCFYATAKRNDSKQYLLKIDLTGSIKEVGEIPNANINNSVGVYLMAANRDGELYGIFKEGETYNNEQSPYRHGSMLCKINTGTASITPIGWTGMYFESLSCAMAFDYKTNALIGTNDNGNDKYIFSIDTKTGRATRLAAFVSYNNGIFQLLPESRLLTVGVKSGQEEMGDAVILESGKQEGRFLPGDEVDIEAFKKTNEYRFVKWSDGSTENPRTITIGDEASYTLTAEFDWAEGIVASPIYIGKKQITSHTGTLTNANLDAIKGGSISYNAATKTLTLTDLDLEYYQTEPALKVYQEDAENLADVTIKLVGTNTIVSTTTENGALCFCNANVKIEGEGSLDVSVLSTFYPGCNLNNANLTIEGTNVNISGNDGALKGNGGEENMAIIGSDVEFNSSVTSLKSLTYNYCTLTTPVGAEFNEEHNQIEVGGSVYSATIKFSSMPRIRAKALEEGTGTFTIVYDDGTEEFGDLAFAPSGTDITITAIPEDGFEFVRWEEDPNWGDEEKESDWWGPEIKVSTLGVDEAYTAVFYYTASSSKTWYGINKSNFVSFDISDQAAHPQVSTSSTVGILAGDYREGNWEYQLGSEIKAAPFSGVVDKEELPGIDDAEAVVKGMSVDFTDMAFDMVGGDMYGVSGTELYRVNYGDEKVEKIGDFVDEHGISVGAHSIAINSSSEKYILEQGAPGKLYRVTDIDDEHKKVHVEPVGEEEGSIGRAVTMDHQSIAFDLVTDELFWGAEDYLRIINTETAKTHICGDLGYKKGSQGVLKALHCENEFASVSVKVANECKGMGKVSITSAGYGAGKLIAGKPTKFTITATPEDGYKFLYWMRSGNKTEIEEVTYPITVSSGATFTAYFEEEKKPDEGIEDVQSDVQCTKIVIDGRLYIIRDGRIYDAIGTRVK